MRPYQIQIVSDNRKTHFRTISPRIQKVKERGKLSLLAKFAWRMDRSKR